MESFSWVLTYITVAKIEYKGRTIKISSLPGVDSWFRDGDKSEREAHVSSKLLMHSKYGRTQAVSTRYRRYQSTIQRIIWYWSDFHESRRPEAPILEPEMTPIPEEPVISEPEVDDPTETLRLFIKTVGGSFREAVAGEGFEEIKACLLEAIGIPTVGVETV